MRGVPFLVFYGVYIYFFRECDIMSLKTLSKDFDGLGMRQCVVIIDRRNIMDQVKTGKFI